MVRRLLFLVLVLVFLAVTFVAVYLFVPLVGDLSNKSLAHSVAREVETEGEPKKASCRPQGEASYTCRVPGGSGKGVASYKVRMEDRRCYTARRTQGQGKRRTDGCVGLRDELRFSLLERIL